MQFHPRGILLKWLPICPHIKRLRNVSLGLLRLFWCAFKKPVCVEGAHSQLAGTQWLHLSLKVNTHRGGPQIWPFQMPKPPLPPSSPSYVTMNKFPFKSTYCAIAQHCGGVNAPEQMTEQHHRWTKLALNCKRDRNVRCAHNRQMVCFFSQNQFDRMISVQNKFHRDYNCAVIQYCLDQPIRSILNPQERSESNTASHP